MQDHAQGPAPCSIGTEEIATIVLKKTRAKQDGEAIRIVRLARRGAHTSPAPSENYTITTNATTSPN